MQLLKLRGSCLPGVCTPRSLAHGLSHPSRVLDLVLAAGRGEPLLCVAHKAQRAQRVSNACSGSLTGERQGTRAQ